MLCKATACRMCWGFLLSRAFSQRAQNTWHRREGPHIIGLFAIDLRYQGSCHRIEAFPSKLLPLLDSAWLVAGAALSSGSPAYWFLLRVQSGFFLPIQPLQLNPSFRTSIEHLQILTTSDLDAQL